MQAWGRAVGHIASQQRVMSSTAGAGPSKVRLVLFDVFDTLCTPRKPIHEQYYEEAVHAGLSSTNISPQSVRAAFKPAFKHMDSTFPLYGKRAQPPIPPEEWWTQLIRLNMIQAGASEVDVEDVMGRLGPALLGRFESDEGYRDFPETLDVLRKLRQMGIKTSVVSNADPRILKTLDSLAILPLLSHAPTLSWDVESSKPSPEIFHAACKACDEPPGEGVIMVGDELVADYGGATAADLEGRLIRRQGEWSDGAVRKSSEDLSGVKVMTSLTDVLQEVARRNGVSGPS